MSFEIRPATRQGVKPLIGLYSESGCGKTYSALRLARGFVGPSGKIIMADSESGRGELYADVLPGGYQVLRIDPPFSPQRYIEAHDAIVKAGAAIGVIDSGSHEWEGEGGILDMAGDNEQRSGKSGLHNWKTPKLEHAKFMLCLLRSPIPWVICLRAKYKSRQGKDDRGKTVIVKDDHTSPIQAEDFIFEMTAHAEIMPDHSIHLTKCSHPSLRDCFPVKGPITEETGAKIAQWCAAPGKPAEKSYAAPSKASDAMKKALWSATKEIHGGDKQALAQWLWDEAILSDTETLAGLSVVRLREVVAKVEEKLGQGVTP